MSVLIRDPLSTCSVCKGLSRHLAQSSCHRCPAWEGVPQSPKFSPVCGHGETGSRGPESSLWFLRPPPDLSLATVPPPDRPLQFPKLALISLTSGKEASFLSGRFFLNLLGRLNPLFHRCQSLQEVPPDHLEGGMRYLSCPL